MDQCGQTPAEHLDRCMVSICRPSALQFQWNIPKKTEIQVTYKYSYRSTAPLSFYDLMYMYIVSKVTFTDICQRDI